jgi:predicted alpha/beta hydrolase family esterase
MPSPQNAKYAEWKLWIEKYFSILQGDIILIGHSLGAAFLLKYISESGFPVSIAQLHLVATPVADTEKESLCDFKLKNFELKVSRDIDLGKADVNKIFLYHSVDDEVVPYSDTEKLHKALPQAEFLTFQDMGHFSVEEFPELVELVHMCK